MDYDTALELCEKIGELCKKGLSAETRMEIFEEAFEQYTISNSGFDDSLRNLMIEIFDFLFDHYSTNGT